MSGTRDNFLYLPPVLRVVNQHGIGIHHIWTLIKRLFCRKFHFRNCIISPATTAKMADSSKGAFVIPGILEMRRLLFSNLAGVGPGDGIRRIRWSIIYCYLNSGAAVAEPNSTGLALTRREILYRKVEMVCSFELRRQTRVAYLNRLSTVNVWTYEVTPPSSHPPFNLIRREIRKFRKFTFGVGQQSQSQ